MTKPKEPKPLLEQLDSFMSLWGSTTSKLEWFLMRNDLLCIVAAAKQEEAEERGRAVERLIDKAFRSEV